VFSLMREYERAWLPVRGSAPVDLFGFPHDVGLDPIEVNVERMLGVFRAGCSDLCEVWSLALEPATLASVRELQCAATPGAGRAFHLDDELWTKIIYEFALAHARRPLERGHLLRSLTPLYLGRVASFVLETRDMFASQVEDRIERLALAFETAKTALADKWHHPGAGGAERPVSTLADSRPSPEQMEVTS
jgi:hypothetical protein